MEGKAARAQENKVMPLFLLYWLPLFVLEYYLSDENLNFIPDPEHLRGLKHIFVLLCLIAAFINILLTKWLATRKTIESPEAGSPSLRIYLLTFLPLAPVFFGVIVGIPKELLQHRNDRVGQYFESRVQIVGSEATHGKGGSHYKLVVQSEMGSAFSVFVTETDFNTASTGSFLKIDGKRSTYGTLIQKWNFVNQ